MPGLPEIWCADVDALTFDEMALSDQELARAARFHYEIDRRRFGRRRALLRRLLARYLGLEAADIRLATNTYGKPRVEDGGGLTFNLSHSGGEAVYIFATGREVGIDVELPRPGIDTAAIGASFFASEERAWIEALPPTRREQAFYNCWTRKEAYVKAVGGGLSIPLDEFAVPLDPADPPRLLRCDWDPRELSRWTLLPFTPRAGFVGAVAVEGACDPPRVRRLEAASGL